MLVLCLYGNTLIYDCSMRKNEQYWLAGILFFAFCIFAFGLPNAFVSDDFSTIVNNPLVRTWHFEMGQIWGVLQRLIYFVIANTIGITPWPFRMVNILAHLTSTYFLFLILRKMYEFSTAIIACALFVVAPTIVEPVIWISGMPYALGGMFAVWCIYLHLLEKRTLLSEVGEVVVWLLALVSNEKYIFLPILLLGWDFVYGRLRNKQWALAGLMTISLVRGIDLLMALGGQAEVLTRDYYNTNVLLVGNPVVRPLVAIGNYVWLYFWPQALTLYHSEVDFGWQSTLRFGLVTGLLFVWAYLLSKKVKSAWFWVGFFIVPMMPTLLPLGVSSIVAERYAYLSYMALATLTSLTLTHIPDFDSKKSWIYLGVGVACLALTARTWWRIYDWRDADSLWFSAENYSPHSPQNHNNLGDAYTNHGNPRRAIEEFSIAIALNPNYADAIHNRADTYLRLGEKEKAREGFTEAVKINPRLWQSYLKLASIAIADKEWQAAREMTTKALAINDSEAIRKLLTALNNELESKKVVK